MRTIISLFLITAASAIVAFAAGCRGDTAASGPIEVVATTTQVADIARQITGQRAIVTGLLEPNSDPHSFEPRPSDAVAVADAELVIRSGGSVDSWLDPLLDGSGGDASVLDLLAVVDPDPGATDPDPHWWQDPANAIESVSAIRDRLVALDPANADEYRRNAARYALRLERVDDQIANCIGAVPSGRRTIVTAHDSLAYFANRYGIEIVGAAVPAQTTQAQASSGAIAELVDAIRANHVSAVFPEAGANGELERAIAAEAGATVGAELWADALGPAGSSGSSYAESLLANADTLVRGMTGSGRGCAASAGETP